MLVIAEKPWLPLASHNVSSATDEKVVNPLSTPTKIKRRSFAVKIERVSASPVRNPITKHPKQLTASVPYGNRDRQDLVDPRAQQVSQNAANKSAGAEYKTGPI